MIHSGSSHSGWKSSCYNLLGVITHGGSDPAQGHYSSYINHPTEGWTHIDDSNVKGITFDKMQKQIAKTSYIIIMGKYKYN